MHYPQNKEKQYRQSKLRNIAAHKAGVLAEYLLLSLSGLLGVATADLEAVCAYKPKIQLMTEAPAMRQISNATEYAARS